MYLFYFGFAINNNTYNKFNVDILLKLNDDQCFNIKQALLGKNNSTKHFILGLNILDKHVQKFFYNLRLMLFNDSNCYISNRTHPINRLNNLIIKLKTNKNTPFSSENEKNVFEKIKEIMTNYLKKYQLH